MGKASRRKKEQKQRRQAAQAYRPAASTPAAPRAQGRQTAAPAPRTPAVTAARPPAKPTLTSTASAAYQEWVREAISTQRSQMSLPAEYRADEEPHVLAPLVRRMGQTPAGRSFMVDLSPVYDPHGRRYTTGLAVSAEDPKAKPDAFGMPQFGPGFALPLPYELRSVRAADAVTWLIYRAISDGKLDPERGDAVAAYAGRAAAAATPNQLRLAPGYTALPSNVLFDYEGFGDSAVEDPVSPDLTAAQRQKGPAPLPAGDWLVDDPADAEGRRMAYGIEEVRDYTAGLWVVEHFDLPHLIGLLPDLAQQRAHVVAFTQDLAHAVDSHLAEEMAATEQGMREGLATPAEITEEIAPALALREEIRAATTVQQVLPVLARALFELQPPAPEGAEDDVLEGEVTD